MSIFSSQVKFILFIEINPDNRTNVANKSEMLYTYYTVIQCMIRALILFIQTLALYKSFTYLLTALCRPVVIAHGLTMQ